jgi:hypothetical protein
MDTDTLYKARIKQRLAEILISAWEKQQLHRANVSYLAGVIREELDAAENSAQVYEFVEALIEEWPVFASITAEPDIRPISEGGQE